MAALFIIRCGMASSFPVVAMIAAMVVALWAMVKHFGWEAGWRAAPSATMAHGEDQSAAGRCGCGGMGLTQVCLALFGLSFRPRSSASIMSRSRSPTAAEAEIQLPNLSPARSLPVISRRGIWPPLYGR